MKFIFSILFLFLFNGTFGQNPEGFEQMCQDTISGVTPTVSVQELKQLKDNKKVVILDAREKKEFDVSRIPGAFYVGYDNFNLNAVSGIFAKDVEIYVYCSIGYRSEFIAYQLIDAGYTNVYNVVGGIFGWFNNGYPLSDGKKEVKKIHGYDKDWAKWLNSEQGKIILK